MEIPYYEVDAFTDAVFGGNPAGVCLLESWLPDGDLQRIAAENNFSETAFLIGWNGRYELRWFTPAIEVDLCGHATLASAHVLLQEVEPDLSEVTFSTQSGELTVKRQGDLLAMDFPSRPPVACEAPGALLGALKDAPCEVLRARDYICLYESEDAVRRIEPDFEKLAEVECTGIIITAPGDEVDFVSRFFAPRAGVPEDPVTGSAHCTLVPYWAEKLGKLKLHARQISTRGGELFCELRGDRCTIAGRAVLYMKGQIHV